jgi:hypothetical protein
MNRRSFLWNCGGGFGGVALAHLSGRDAIGATKGRPELNGGLHHRARAKRVIQLFMSGAASQCDTFDYKPLLIRKAGEQWDPGEKVELFQSSPGVVMPSPWGWKQHGRCGKWVSDLLPHTATCVDDIAFVASLISQSRTSTVRRRSCRTRGSSCRGSRAPARGSRMRSEARPRICRTSSCCPIRAGCRPNGAANWSAGFLPAAQQATSIRVGTPQPIHDLRPPASASFITAESERDGLALLANANRDHMADRSGDSRLEARIASYEMAARLQLSAPDVLDISTSEPDATRKLYGLDSEVTEDMGRRCLVARRLVERGVRFVQVWSGADNGFPRRNWDSHENLAKDHGELGAALDQPVAGLLLKDLKSRGLLDDTIVYWTTEFGRMPCSQGSKGRDHNPFGFTSWFAGGGYKGGVTYGPLMSGPIRPLTNRSTVTTCTRPCCTYWEWTTRA